jgi:hypothetical protein
MIDRSKKYLFHNVYGDADALIANAPSDVIVIPFGWDKQTEDNRNAILAELNTTVSSLPAVLFFGKEFIAYAGEDVERIEPAKWEEVRVGTLEKPWNWADIQLCIDIFFENPVEGVPSGIPD